MIKENFDISKRPLQIYANAVYLVDSTNVELHRKYVEKYYDHDELKWFDINVLRRICKNKENIFMLKYADEVIYDSRLRNVVDVPKDLTVHYVTQALALMTVE